MTKEQIIKDITEKFIIIVMEEKPYERQDYIQNANQALSKTADTLHTKFEQEKKEIVECKDRTMQRLLEVQKREIFRAMYEKLLGSGHSYLVKELAKEYGVEL